jgi:hypothetical protein
MSDKGYVGVAMTMCIVGIGLGLAMWSAMPLRPNDFIDWLLWRCESVS